MPRKISILLCASLLLLAAPRGALAEDAGGMQATVGAYRGMVEEHMAGVLNTIKALAATAEVQSADWDRMKGALTEVGSRMPDATTLWFANPDGSYYTVQKGATGVNMSDRAYFPPLMAGKDVIDSLVLGRSTGERQIIVATPVKKGGRIVGIVGTAISAEKLSKLIDQRLNLPANMVFFALDARGQTALHRDPKLIFQYPAEVGGASLAGAVREMLAAPEGEVHYTFRGADKMAYFQKSAAMDWVFAIGVTKAQ
jgi:C4-dicarboxylate-specific signal transduction histidine kinase